MRQDSSNYIFPTTLYFYVLGGSVWVLGLSNFFVLLYLVFAPAVALLAAIHFAGKIFRSAFSLPEA